MERSVVRSGAGPNRIATDRRNANMAKALAAQSDLGVRKTAVDEPAGEG
jgi:hypothetical protein